MGYRMKAQFRAILILALILSLLTPAVHGQTEYRLDTGDVLTVTVAGEEGLGAMVEIGPDGLISLPMVGAVQARGRTVYEIRDEIRTKLLTYLRNPVVNVVVSKFRTARVFILGAVKSPGMHSLIPGTSLLGAISASGGLLPDADRTSIIHTRPDGSKTYTYDTLLENVGITVSDGDAIYIPQILRTISVLGQVLRPGSFPLSEGMRVLDAIALAGGAKTPEARAVHRGAEYRLRDLISGSADNPLLAPGDTVYIPEDRADILVLGEVFRPGQYPLIQGMRLLDAISLAGGPRSPFARAVIAGVEYIVSELLSGSAENPELSPGDVVYIPQDIRQVSVVGEVHRPGSYAFTEGMRLLDALSLAGGVKPQALTIQYKGKHIQARDLISGSAENPVLSPGDIIYIPEHKHQASIFGEVQRPGSYPLTEGMRLLDLIALAGGARSQEARAILRDQEYRVHALISGDSDNPVLSPGDVAFIPQENRQVAVLGEVQRPGAYSLTPSMRLLDALSQAGGAKSQTAKALLRGVEYYIPDLVSDAADNPVLSPGDVVYVPQEIRQVSVLGEAQRPGSFPLTEGMRLIDALSLAGGTKSQTARAVLRGKEYPVQDLLAGKTDNPVLSPGDVVFIPQDIRQVAVLGEVHRPGSYPLTEDMKVLDAISLAGGAKSPKARIVLRGNEMSLEDLIQAKEENLTLLPGDLIYVPEEIRYITILGEVQRPGHYPLPRNARLMDAIALAGGPTAKGSLEKVTVYQAGSVSEPSPEPIGKGQVLFSGKVTDNPSLNPGDMVYIPRSGISVNIMGKVARPGTYDLTEGSRLLDALSASGGTGADADLSSILISGTEGARTIDISGLGSSQTENPELAHGDLVFVPEHRPTVTVLGHAARPGVYPLIQAMTITEAIAAAGGIGPKADHRRIALIRESGIYTIDLESIVQGKAQAPYLLSRDTIFIPESAPEQVLVLGDVLRPGAYGLAPGQRVLDALALAGGARKPDAIIVWAGVRDGEAATHSHGLEALLAPGSAHNRTLEPGDMVYVPESQDRATILGEVARPGVYQLPRHATAVDLIALAGGASDRADLGRIRIYHGQDIAQAAELGLADDDLVYSGDIKKNPSIAPGQVMVVPRNTVKAYVAGFVNRPGLIEVKAGSSILDAILAGGGIARDGDATAVIVTSKVTGPAEYNMESVLEGKATVPRLSEGDVIYVPKAIDARVFVLGGVHRPGSFQHGPKTTVLEAIAMAGGPKSHNARATLTKAQDGSVETISLQSLFGGQEADLSLDPGDIVYIPEDPRQVSVLGEVHRPGLYTISDTATLIDLIAMAGGVTDKAALEEVAIYRDSPIPAPLGAGKALYIGAPKGIAIQPGDVVHVPKKTITISIMGRASRPGVYEVPKGTGLLQALAQAGGIAQAGDESVILSRLVEGSPESHTIALETLVRDPKKDMPLTDGDLIYIPENKLRDQVAVLGEVVRPGLYPISPNTTLLDALALAGGLGRYADSTRIKVYSGEDTEEAIGLDVGDRSLVYEGDIKSNPRLIPGQIILVPTTAVRVYVSGFVSRPGEVVLTKDGTITDAISQTGGIRPDGDGHRVMITRKGQVLAELDYERAIRTKAALPVLEDGDGIFVPEAINQVLVLGEVTRPGAYRINRDARVMDAIALAGGTTPRASLEDITIRSQESSTSLSIGEGRALFSGTAAKNPAIHNGDIIFVGSKVIQASVMGRVARPGRYDLLTGSKITDALIAAGGASRDTGSIILTRASGESISIFLDGILKDPSNPANYILGDGDIIYIPEMREQVTVIGEVPRPGVFNTAPGMTLMDALALAGGIGPKSDASRVRIYRGDSTDSVVDLSLGSSRLLYEGDIKLNPKIEPGMIIMVPSSAIKVQVAGHVARAGSLELLRGSTLVDAITQAGGIGPNGDPTRVVLTRRSASGNTIIESDVESILTGRRQDNTPLQDGDTIFVPEAYKRIVVMGAVPKPGVYEYRKGMRVIEALALAGGATREARLDRIMVYSGDDVSALTMGQNQSVIRAATIDPGKGNNPELKAGDIIIVPQSDRLDMQLIISVLAIANQLRNLVGR